MINLRTPPPITGPQAAYVSRLIASVGKSRYLAVKRRLGLDDFTVMRLSKKQAADLIRGLLETREGQQ